MDEPTISAEAIEAAARAFWADWDLDDETPEDREHCFQEARRALAAAAPHILRDNQPEASGDMLQEIRDLLAAQRCTHLSPCVDCRINVRGAAEATASFVAAQVAAARTQALEDALAARCPRVGCPLGLGD